MLQMKEHSQKLTPYLFQNDVVLYLELIGNEKMWLTTIFGTLIS